MPVIPPGWARFPLPWGLILPFPQPHSGWDVVEDIQVSGSVFVNNPSPPYDPETFILSWWIQLASHNYLSYTFYGSALHIRGHDVWSGSLCTQGINWRRPCTVLLAQLDGWVGWRAGVEGSAVCKVQCKRNLPPSLELVLSFPSPWLSHLTLKWSLDENPPQLDKGSVDNTRQNKPVPSPWPTRWDCRNVLCAILPPRSHIFSVLHSSISGDGKRIVHGTGFNSLYTPQKGSWGKVPDTFLPATSGWVFLSWNWRQ